MAQPRLDRLGRFSGKHEDPHIEKGVGRSVGTDLPRRRVGTAPVHVGQARTPLEGARRTPNDKRILREVAQDLESAGLQGIFPFRLDGSVEVDDADRRSAGIDRPSCGRSRGESREVHGATEQLERGTSSERVCVTALFPQECKAPFSAAGHRERSIGFEQFGPRGLNLLLRGVRPERNGSEGRRLARYRGARIRHRNLDEEDKRQRDECQNSKKAKDRRAVPPSNGAEQGPASEARDVGRLRLGFWPKSRRRGARTENANHSAMIRVA